MCLIWNNDKNSKTAIAIAAIWRIVRGKAIFHAKHNFKNRKKATFSAATKPSTSSSSPFFLVLWLLMMMMMAVVICKNFFFCCCCCSCAADMIFCAARCKFLGSVFFSSRINFDAIGYVKTFRLNNFAERERASRVFTTYKYILYVSVFGEDLCVLLPYTLSCSPSASSSLVCCRAPKCKTTKCKFWCVGEKKISIASKSYTLGECTCGTYKYVSCVLNKSTRTAKYEKGKKNRVKQRKAHEESSNSIGIMCSKYTRATFLNPFSDFSRLLDAARISILQFSTCRSFFHFWPFDFCPRPLATTILLYLSNRKNENQVVKSH